MESHESRPILPTIDEKNPIWHYKEPERSGRAGVGDITFFVYDRPELNGKLVGAVGLAKNGNMKVAHGIIPYTVAEARPEFIEQHIERSVGLVAAAIYKESRNAAMAQAAPCASAGPGPD